jgi:hypothetical protein
MEIYTDTMTASTPSFGMPVVAASPRVAAVCAQQLETATPWAHVAGIAVKGAVDAAVMGDVRGIELDAVRVKGDFPGPTAWRPPIV